MLSKEEIENIFKDFDLLETESREKVLHKNFETRTPPDNELTFTIVSNITQKENK